MQMGKTTNTLIRQKILLEAVRDKIINKRVIIDKLNERKWLQHKKILELNNKVQSQNDAVISVVLKDLATLKSQHQLINQKYELEKLRLEFLILERNFLERNISLFETKPL